MLGKKKKGSRHPLRVIGLAGVRLNHFWCTLEVAAHLPALNVGLPLLQNLQLLHLPLGLVDAGAHGLHHLQRLLHQHVVVVLLRGPFQQLLDVDMDKTKVTDQTCACLLVAAHVVPD